MTTAHTIKAFDRELAELRLIVSTMGDLAAQQLARVTLAIPQGDADLAKRVIEREPEADRLEHEIETMVIRLLALRQPAASDLREILSALRIANELERICDHAENMAERVIALHGSQIERAPSLASIGQFAATMLADVVDAYKTRDAAKAQDVWARDEELDGMYSGFFRELLTYMVEDPRRVSIYTHLLLMARDIERVGDRATNIAEMIRFLVGGTLVDQERRKADVTRSIVLPP